MTPQRVFRKVASLRMLPTLPLPFLFSSSFVSSVFNAHLWSLSLVFFAVKHQIEHWQMKLLAHWHYPSQVVLVDHYQRGMQSIISPAKAGAKASVLWPSCDGNVNMICLKLSGGYNGSCFTIQAAFEHALSSCWRSCCGKCCFCPGHLGKTPVFRPRRSNTSGTPGCQESEETTPDLFLLSWITFFWRSTKLQVFLWCTSTFSCTLWPSFTSQGFGRPTSFGAGVSGSLHDSTGAFLKFRYRDTCGVPWSFRVLV